MADTQAPAERVRILLAEFGDYLDGIEAETVHETENMLLTFTKIRGGVFRDATRAVIDMSVALGTDAKGAAIQVGKALNDPIKGITALSRVGVTFSEGQKRLIARFVKTGRVAKAQGVILAELKREFGGSAKAFGSTLEGRLKKIGNAFGGIFEGFLQGDPKEVSKQFDRLRTQIERVLFGPKDKKTGERSGGLIASLGEWGSTMGQAILDGIGKVDWGKTLSDTLSAAIAGLQGFVAGPGATQLALVGGAIAGAMFVGSLFIDAAKAIFSPGAWLSGLKGILGAVGAVLGWAMRAGMFVASRFIDAAALMIGTLSRDKIVRGSAKGLGASVGGSVLSGIVAGLTGAVAIGAVAQALTKLFTSAEADWTKRGPRPLPDSPFKWPWQQGGFFFPNNARGTSNWRGGPTWVGEEGPEIVNVPRGAEIVPHRASMAMAGGGATNVYVTVNAGVGTDGRRVGEQIVDAIIPYLRTGGRIRLKNALG